MLIPTVVPDRIRHRILHNHLDLVLSHAPQEDPTVTSSSRGPAAPLG
ncbi:MAG: hypothetical protein M0Z30_11880 [Actinomycetota bacterium]|nr:hypothetical protein [Actinomycetota bacterium]